MRRVAGWQRLRSRAVVIPVLVLVVLVVALAVVRVTSSSGGYTTRAQFVAGVPEANGAPVRLDTTLYLPERTPAPAVLVSPGFGGDKDSVAGTAKKLAQHGYVALAYTPRGFGDSGGLIHFDSPDFEVKDAERLVDFLTRLPQVDARHIAVAGSSYGGALALLLAAYDKRITAVAADITWNNLENAFFPNEGGSGPGVFKKLWIGTLFADGFAASVSGTIASVLGQDPSTAQNIPTGSIACGRYAPDVCAAYQNAASTGRPDAALRALMAAASPSRVLGRITAPTLLTQGVQDSLFPLSEADANARGIAANGTPVRVVWRAGGHDDPSIGSDVATSAMLSWFGAAFAGTITAGTTGPGTTGPAQPFEFTETLGQISADTGHLLQQVRQADGYPGIDGTPAATTSMTLAGPPQPVSAPAGGTPAAITAVPGLGGALSGLGVAAATVPGQTAVFSSAPVRRATLVVGSATVPITVTPHTTSDAVLFVSLRDVDPGGRTSVLPSDLVSAVRLTGLTPGRPSTVRVRLPAIVRSVPVGHRIVLTVSTTDFAYALPSDPRSYTIGLAPGATLRLPTVDARTIEAGNPWAWLIVAAIVTAAAVLVAVAVIRRRRRVVKPRPELADVPVQITDLVKQYHGGYRAVDAVSFTVEPGQVLGLLGPNGAGKTTVLRVLVGLITPTSGEVHVFGEPIVPGASVLARVGAFIEGPGFLPHLSGRENLRLYWEATGRPPEEAEFETALQIAGLGASIDRRVRTYSHGMRQRLGIAQAMLGLPELLVLDEPTNGLDPPQIAEMREVMQRYAHTGRTVIVSSHLLAEVEQTCTHLVVMHKGKLVAAGPTGEIAGAGGRQLAVDDPDRAVAVLTQAGITATLVPARRALEDVFLDLIGGEDQ